MTRNMGSIDRGARLVAGAILLALAWGAPVGVLQGGTGQIVAAVAGVVLILTALVRWCPLYTLLGITTCRVR